VTLRLCHADGSKSLGAKSSQVTPQGLQIQYMMCDSHEKLPQLVRTSWIGAGVHCGSIVVWQSWEAPPVGVRLLAPPLGVLPVNTARD
jgi:hypothetical protein